MAIALLGAVSEMWVFAYLVGDLSLFLLYKLLRSDFFYFVPVESYMGSIAVALVNRIAIKVGVFSRIGRFVLFPSHPVQTIARMIDPCRLYICANV